MWFDAGDVVAGCGLRKMRLADFCAFLKSFKPTKSQRKKRPFITEEVVEGGRGGGAIARRYDGNTLFMSYMTEKKQEMRCGFVCFCRMCAHKITAVRDKNI